MCDVYRNAGRRIGAVLKKFAPFLKIYKDYIINFDNACDLINTWTAKSAKFAAFLAEIHVNIIQAYCEMIIVILVF